MHLLIIPLFVLGSLGLGWILDYFTDGATTYSIIYSVANFLFDIVIRLLSLLNLEFMNGFSLYDMMLLLPEEFLMAVNFIGLPTAFAMIVGAITLRLVMSLISVLIPFFKL